MTDDVDKTIGPLSRLLPLIKITSSAMLINADHAALAKTSSYKPMIAERDFHGNGPGQNKANSQAAIMIITAM